MSSQIPPLEETQRLPGALLWRTSKLWQNHMHAALTDLGLSSTNSMVLSNMLRLEREHQKITQAQVALLCGTDRMTISTILRTLTSKGLVERKADEADKRHLELQLTPEGRELAYEALERIAEVHENFFQSLSGQETAQLAAHLSQLLDSNSSGYPPTITKKGRKE